MADLVNELQRLELSAQDIRRMVDWPDTLVEDYLSIIRNLVLLATQLTETAGATEDTASAIDHAAAIINQINKMITDMNQKIAMNASALAVERIRKSISFAEVAARVEIGI